MLPLCPWLSSRERVVFTPKNTEEAIRSIFPVFVLLSLTLGLIVMLMSMYVTLFKSLAILRYNQVIN